MWLPRLSQGSVSFPQADNFQDGTTQNWTDGAGNNASNIGTGGPAGAGDRYLQVVSGAFGGGPRLVVFNESQWVGNFSSKGITGISMSLQNFSGGTLPIRIAIREAFGGSGTPGYASSVPFNLAADGQWHTAFFSFSAGSLTGINSPQPLATDLANVADFRILSSASPSLIGDSISAKIGVDNITALPEPGALALIGLGIAGIWLKRRKA
jgi:hypothetical protein